MQCTELTTSMYVFVLLCLIWNDNLICPTLVSIVCISISFPFILSLVHGQLSTLLYQESVLHMNMRLVIMWTVPTQRSYQDIRLATQRVVQNFSTWLPWLVALVSVQIVQIFPTGLCMPCFWRIVIRLTQRISILPSYSKIIGSDWVNPPWHRTPTSHGHH